MSLRNKHLLGYSLIVFFAPLFILNFNLFFVVRFVQIVILVNLLFLVIKKFVSNIKINVPLNLILLILFFNIIIGMGSVLAIDKEAALKGFFSISFNLLFFVYVLAILNKQNINNALKINISVTFFIAVWALILLILYYKFGYLVNYNFLRAIIPINPNADLRAIEAFQVYEGSNFLRNVYRTKGFFEDPNILGSYIGNLLPLIFSLLFYYHLKKDLKKLTKSFIIFFVCFAALLLTYSRSSYFGLFISMISCVFFLFMYVKKTRPLILKLFLVAIIIFAIIFVGLQNQIFFSNFFARITQKDISFYKHYELFEVALTIFTKNPLLGVGWDNFTVHYNLITDSNVRFAMAHNFYLNVLAEQGILGLFLYLVFITIPLKRLYTLIKSYKYNNLFLQMISIGLFSGIVNIIFSNMFYSNFFLTFNWIYLSLAWAFSYIHLEKNISDKTLLGANFT